MEPLPVDSSAGTLLLSSEQLSAERIENIRHLKAQGFAWASGESSLRCAERYPGVTAPNTVRAGDMTDVAIEEGLLYRAVVLDLFSRRIVG